MTPDTFEVKTGLTYPTDPAVDAALIALREQATAARQKALASGDPRDVDAAKTAERAVHDAVVNALASGTLKRAEMGAHVHDLPAKSLGWLLEQGLIVKVPAPVAAAEAAFASAADQMKAAGLIPASVVKPVPPVAVVPPVVSPPVAAPVPPIEKKG